LVLADARAVGNDERVETDLCIVGAGPAGISLALQFLGSGVRVCLLESGGKDAERRAQRLNRGRSVGYPTYRLHQSRVRAFGGTSRHWFRPGDDSWAARPLDPIDFEVRAGVPYSGWPFGRAHLDPWYAQAQRICQLGPPGQDPVDWADEAAPVLPLPAGSVVSTVFHHGTATFDRYFDQLARASEVTLFLNAIVTGLLTGADPARVDQVEVRRDDGSRWQVAARLVVLAAGGIENPRLLLLGGRAHPQGLGNDRGLVGRFFAERLSCRSGYVVAANPELVRRVGFYGVHPARGTLVQGALRVSDAVQRELELRNCAFFVLPRGAAMTAEAVRSLATLHKAVRRQPWLTGTPGHLRNLAGGLSDLAALARDRLPLPGARGSGRPDVLVLRVQAEQAPNPDSRVTLGSSRDPLGQPVAQLDWRLTDDDRASIRTSQEVMDTALRAAGIGRVEMLLGDEHPAALFEGNFHHLGATRMHPNPNLGVVDADCRVHGLRNLYVAGSSVFPTYGCSNPTLTLVALALRLADHLKQRLTARSGTERA
jgi:choline dehydrogenase-like flavoprotein